MPVIKTFIYKSMKGGIEPLTHLGYKTMFNRVPVQVIAASIEIGFITNLMFPETALPDVAFTSF